MEEWELLDHSPIQVESPEDTLGEAQSRTETGVLP